MNGILVIDKPPGVTSFDVVRQVRRLCKTRRVGHAGTLDPLATGILPVAVGSATRLVEYLMAGDKTYQATLELGAVTATQDSEGPILEEHDWQAVDRAALDGVIAGLHGEIRQLPPMFSALKKNGKPLYQLARQGIEVERQARTVRITSLTINVFDPPKVTFTVQCSKGTYVRTLCHDIGQKLGCGAHMTSLRRLACGRFDLEVSHSLEELQALADQEQPLPIISPADALADWPALQIDGAVLARLRNGVAPSLHELNYPKLIAGDQVRFLSGKNLIAVARYAPDARVDRPGDFVLLKVFPALDETG
ncbi:MAG: tRNA pseudouridine(55) synthase TruB [Desulfuromonadales bacterium]